MRRFQSSAQAQRLLSVRGIVDNLFRVGRHLLRTVYFRLNESHPTSNNTAPIQHRRSRHDAQYRARSRLF